MKKFNLMQKDLDILASEVGATELSEPATLSDDPFDADSQQQQTLSFNKNELAWITSKREYMNCIRLDDSGYSTLRQDLDDSRSL